MARADVEAQLLAAIEWAARIGSWAGVTHPGHAILLVDTVADVGGIVMEAAGQEGLKRVAAAAGFGSGAESVVDLLVAFRAGGVGVLESGGGRVWSLRGEDDGVRVLEYLREDERGGERGHKSGMIAKGLPHGCANSLARCVSCLASSALPRRL